MKILIMKEKEEGGKKTGLEKIIAEQTQAVTLVVTLVMFKTKSFHSFKNHILRENSNSNSNSKTLFYKVKVKNLSNH